MIPKPRLDALTDGVFAVAMTLLVIDLHVPEGFHPKDADELLQYILHTWNQVLVYAVSFYVLSLRWVGLVRTNPRGEDIDEAYTKWAMVHLFLITLVPFSTMILGRYVWLAPAVWLYAANTILFAFVALRMLTLSRLDQTSPVAIEDRIGLLVLIAAASLTVVLSFIIPRWAMLGYLLNFTDEPIRRFLLRRKKSPAPV